VSVQILDGDCRDLLPTLPAQSVHCIVTSPPYFGLRDYGVNGQIGLEQTPDAFVAELVAVFREARRVLRDDGTLWLNLGDSYASKFACERRNVIGAGSPDPSVRRANRLFGLKEKDLIGIPWRVAFALQADGWYLRQDIIWAKPNPMPESVRDRCTKAHEYLFLLSKEPRYYYDAEAIAEDVTVGGGRGLPSGDYSAGTGRNDGGRHLSGGFPTGETRNRRSVWTVATQPFSGAHFATFPPDLIEPCIMAGCPVGGTVLDPFGGAGTTGLVADRLQRNAVLIELNPAYADMARERIKAEAGLFGAVTTQALRA
jgi:DNA modification methylase